MIVPDIAVFAWENIPRTREGKIANRFEIAPDWLIEILSPEQSVNKVIKKIVFSVKQGTKLAWLIDPDDQSVTVFYPQALPEVKEKEDLLPGLEGLKDWRLLGDGNVCLVIFVIGLNLGFTKLSAEIRHY